MNATLETPYVEQNCIFAHEGRDFENGGAVVTDDFVYAYPSAKPFNQPTIKDNAERLDTWYLLTDWHGNTIGRIMFDSKWRTPNSFVSNVMFQATAVVNGVKYTGRTCGFSMIYKGRKRARQ